MNYQGELNELESTIHCVNRLAEAELRTQDAFDLNNIRLAMIEALGAARFLASDLRRKMAQEMASVVD